MNEPLSAPLSERERVLLTQKLFALLKKQTELYTMGESSSVTMEIAHELLNGLYFSLAFFAQQPDARGRELLSLDLGAELEAGQRLTRRKTESCKRLWYTVCTSPPPAESRSMTDTLRSIGQGFKKYDPLFFPHVFPCDIDYQLAVAVPDELLGVDYLYRYLRSIRCENRFLSTYGASELLPVLERCCPDYKGQLVNLCEPVFTNALGLELLGRPDGALTLSGDDCEALSSVFAPLSASALALRLEGAAGTLLSRRGLSGDEQYGYAKECCAALAARIGMMAGTQGMRGVFVCV